MLLDIADGRLNTINISMGMLFSISLTPDGNTDSDDVENCGAIPIHFFNGWRGDVYNDSKLIVGVGIFV
jgi:hypothetical protein